MGFKDGWGLGCRDLVKILGASSSTLRSTALSLRGLGGYVEQVIDRTLEHYSPLKWIEYGVAQHHNGIPIYLLKGDYTPTEPLKPPRNRLGFLGRSGGLSR